MALYACDSGGRIVGYTPRAARLWGREPQLHDPQRNSIHDLGQRYCGSTRLYRGDELLPHSASPMARALRTGAAVTGEEITIERDDGSRSTVRASIEPVRGADGRVIGATGVYEDISELAQQRQTLDARERWYRDLLDALPTAIYTTDRDGKITYYNQAAARFSGREPALGSDAWCVTWRLYHPDGRPLPHDECPMAVAVKEERPVRNTEAIAERPDGTRVPFMPFPSPLRDASGRLCGAVNALVDISEGKRAQARQNALLAEINHRVKNTLCTVQSLAAMTLRGAQVPASVRDDFIGRLMALSCIHNHLERAEWQDADLHALFGEILEPYAGVDGGRLRLRGPTLRVSARAALNLGLVMHELAANAARHGALSRPEGRLSLTWSVLIDGEQHLRFDWRETGGPPVSPPTRRGFGSRLLAQAIEHDLRGWTAVTYEPAGLRCAMEIPLTSEAAA